jgi:hypothetical protein
MEAEEPKSWNEESDKKNPASAVPATGLNDNLEFLGRQLHVQTEHLEYPVARIVTQVFCNGRVMRSKKSEYSADIREARDISKIQQLMNVQHYQVIREITEKQSQILGSR